MVSSMNMNRIRFRIRIMNMVMNSFSRFMNRIMNMNSFRIRFMVSNANSQMAPILEIFEIFFDLFCDFIYLSYFQ